MPSQINQNSKIGANLRKRKNWTLFLIPIRLDWRKKNETENLICIFKMKNFTFWQIRCRRHSGIQYLSPVLEHSGTGLVPALAFWYRTDRILDSSTLGHIPALKNLWRWKETHPARPNCWWWKGIHPARPNCWRWKGIHPASPKCMEVERDTPCTSIHGCFWCCTWYTVRMLLKNHNHSKCPNAGMPG